MFLFRTIKTRLRNTFMEYKGLHKLSFPKNKTYINGKWVAANDGKEFTVFNPADGSVVANAPDCGIDELNGAVESAYDAFKVWRNTTAKERSDILRRLFDLQMKYTDDLAHILTLEAGKSLKESVGEIHYGASFLEWFSEEARRIYGDIVPSPDKSKQMSFLRQPVGVVGIITPWNSPNATITRKVAAALAAGCTCVIKPAEDTPLLALALAQLAEEAKVPPGVINVVTSSRNNSPAIGKRLCEHLKVATISFTGSTAVGKFLLGHSAPFVKKISMELGGNAAFIIFNSANISKAVAGAMASKFKNAGQSCICANRILVQEEVYDKFCEEFARLMQSQLIVGNGMDPKVTVGPLINDNALKKVDSYVQDALQKGAKLVIGGKPHPIGYSFYEPTLLTNIKPNMLMCEEEIFGPVAGIMKFKSEEEAIEIANSTRSGLAGYFYSEDISQIHRVAKALEVGMVGVNEGLPACAEAAFGGIKESGLGREGSRYGIDEYVYMKYVCIGGLD